MSIALNKERIGAMPQPRTAVDGKAKNSMDAGELSDPVSRKVFRTNERPSRDDVKVSKHRTPRFSKAFNNYFQDCRKREARDSMKLEETPSMGHRKTYTERLKTDAGDYETDRHNQHDYSKMTDTVAGARKAVEMARNLEEQTASEILYMVAKKHPQILINRRRF